MGAGTALAGASGAGTDVPTTSAKAVATLPPDPVLYDLATRGTPRDANGFLKTVHWVDQAVALALGVRNGALTSQSSLGNTLRDIKRTSGPTVQGDVEKRVRVALSALVGRGDAGVLSVEATSPLRGQIVVVVSYVNLRLAGSVPRDVKFVF